MKNTTPLRTVLLNAALALLVVTVVGVQAQTPAAPVTQAQLAGLWTLVAADDLHPDGSRTPAYGSHPQGLLMMDQSGRYSLQIFRTDRPKFASGDKLFGTAEEYKVAVVGTSTHIGRYSEDAANGMLVFEIEFASFPNLDGAVQRRPFQLSGDELSYHIPAKANGTVPVSVWRRVK